MSLTVEYFNGQEKEWDNFVMNISMNGTFLQTRKFINYHEAGKFKDVSLCIRKGDELVAVIMACEVEDDGKKTFFAHKGSTYGGITISEKIYNASEVSELMDVFHEFIRKENFEKIYLKMVPDVYQRKNTDLLDYFLYKNGYECFNELNYYMHLERYKDNVISQFSSSKRRDYRYSLKQGLKFKKLETKAEMAAYYDILLKNLTKFNARAVHSLENLYDLRFNRFQDRIEFYGVYLENKMIAGSMIFIFDDKICHTQYLSSDEEYLKLYPMDFLIENLIQTAVDRGRAVFTLGVCTENQGKYLNLGLSRFKEGFGTEFCINRSYEKSLLNE